MKTSLVSRVGIALAAALTLLAPGVPAAWAARTEPLPKELEGVGIVEHAGDRIPLDLAFTAEDGSTVRLADLVRGDRPVILTLVYYRCPMLCGLLLNGLLDGLKELQWTVGKEFDVVTVSIDPLETPTLARLKKQTFAKEYGRAGVEGGWHFLTGRQAEITRLADAVGFEYRYDEEKKQYIHAAGVFVLTPEGRLARYLYGVMYDGRTLKLALTEAARGTVGTSLDQLLLTCFHYDAEAGRYVVAATRVMRAGGLVTAVALGAFLLAGWRRAAARGKAAGGGGRS